MRNSGREGYLYFEDVNWGLLRLWADQKGLEVLDVGCGFATTSGRIQAMGNRVTGIECSARALAVAGTRLERTIPMDLQDLAALCQNLGEKSFDALIFADVLEHLADPTVVLKAYLRLLRPGGTVLVSLPNVGLWSVRLSLLLGRWNYTDTGVLDRTHLRFFTWKSARSLLAEAGVETVKTTANPGLVRPFIPLIKKIMAPKGNAQGLDPSALLDSGAYRAYLRVVHPVERVLASLWPPGLAFQMVFAGRVQGEKA
jgi:SAM-dependent methyltransferase